MDEFMILTNRKRALIALAHSLVFLGIAMHGFVAPRRSLSLPQGELAALAPVAIYVVVASILGWLTTISRCARERIYFALCAASASFGLLRMVFGDVAFPAAQYLRITMLACAVVVGLLILRWHSAIAVPSDGD